MVIKSHGGTDAVGFAYALEEAFHEAQADSLHKIEQSVATQLTQFQEKKMLAEQASMTGSEV